MLYMIGSIKCLLKRRHDFFRFASDVTDPPYLGICNRCGKVLR